jgi:hypothetical protein
MPLSVRSPKLTKRLKNNAPPPPDLKQQPNAHFVRTTAEIWTNSKDLLEKLAIPLGVSFQPLSEEGVIINFLPNHQQKSFFFIQTPVTNTNLVRGMYLLFLI